MQRRQFARLAAATLLPLLLPRAARAQPAGDLRLLQCVDTAAAQQELTRDYAVGVQLAAQAINLAGGVNGRLLRVVGMPVEASPAGVAAVVDRLRGEPDLLGVVGAVGESLADATVRATRAAGLGVAHLGPWLGDTAHDDDPGVLPLFASREMQVEGVLKSLRSMGITRIGIVHDARVAQTGFAEAARRAGVAVAGFPLPVQGGAETLARALPDDAPAVLCFLGGTIELAVLGQALAARGRQRWLVHLGDANLALLTQLGATRATPLILTQVVPNPVSETRPFAQDYRARLRQFSDEEPAPMSLAGWLVGRCMVKLLQRLGPRADRAALLEEVRRRPSIDVDGFAFSFGPGRTRGSTLVVQTMISRDGRLIG